MGKAKQEKIVCKLFFSNNLSFKRNCMVIFFSFVFFFFLFSLFSNFYHYLLYAVIFNFFSSFQSSTFYLRFFFYFFSIFDNRLKDSILFYFIYFFDKHQIKSRLRKKNLKQKQTSIKNNVCQLSFYKGKKIKLKQTK